LKKKLVLRDRLKKVERIFKKNIVRLFKKRSNVSREEVDLWYDKVKEIGGTIFSEPENFQEGYTFGFADPDGHKFNFLYWPGM